MIIFVCILFCSTSNINGGRNKVHCLLDELQTYSPTFWCRINPPFGLYYTRQHFADNAFGSLHPRQFSSGNKAKSATEKYSGPLRLHYRRVSLYQLTQRFHSFLLLSFVNVLCVLLLCFFGDFIIYVYFCFVDFKYIDPILPQIFTHCNIVPIANVKTEFYV